MPGKRLSMRKTTEVLRLRAAGTSGREIARAVGVARSTVAEYLRRADAAGLSWPLPDDLDEQGLDALLFPETERTTERPVPDWAAVRRELKSRKHHMTLRLLWLEWKAEHPDGWGYSQYCEHYRRWLATKDVVMRLSYAAGERMFVDFSGDKAIWCDPDTGDIHEADVFVAILGYSGLLYVEATRGQDLGSWVGAHVAAWESFDGVSEVTVPDNLRSAVTKACFYEPELNPTYAELATHYDTVVLPTRTYRPRDKAAVEAGVLTVERWVLAPLRNRRFFSLAELNQAIATQVAMVNDPSLQGRGHFETRTSSWTWSGRLSARYPPPATSWRSGRRRPPASTTTSRWTTGSTRCPTSWCADGSTCGRPRRPSRCSTAASEWPLTCASTAHAATSPRWTICPKATGPTWSGRRRNW